MARADLDPALVTAVAAGFERHVDGTGAYAELDGAAFVGDLLAGGWQANWSGLDDDEDLDLADLVSSAWAECAEPYGDEDDEGVQRVSADPHEVLDKLARLGATFARAA